MAKRSHRSIPKKYFPGLVRITDESGKRVWVYRKNRFDTLRQVLDFDVTRIYAKAKEKTEEVKKD